MTMTAERPLADEETMRALRALVDGREHHIRQDLSRPITAASAASMMRYLQGRPEKVTHVPGDDGRPLCSQPAARPAPRAERVKPSGPGYYFHNGKMYKVIASVYGANPGRLYAKVLSTRTGDWVMATGLISVIDESERVDPSKLAEIGGFRLSSDPGSALYGKCWICGRPLTDENSLREGKGPGPHAGFGD